MDMQKIAREIGWFETAINVARVSDSADVWQKIGAAMPLPDANIESRVMQIAKWLLDFKKSKYMFLTPEIALIEAMAELDRVKRESIIVVPCDMEVEAKERLGNNLPQGAIVTMLEEPYFPEAFFPRNSMLVVCGYAGGDRAMILSDTYRIMEHYRSFLGKKVFVPYVELDNAARYDGWLEVGQQKFSEKWRCELWKVS